MCVQELLDEFFTAVQRRFGNTVLVHLEDMQYENMSKTMAQYSGIFPIFSDDIQGLAAVVIAGILAAAPLTKKRLSDHTFLVAGEGRAATSIAAIMAAAISRENRHKNESIMDARKKVYSSSVLTDRCVMYLSFQSTPALEHRAKFVSAMGIALAVVT